MESGSVLQELKKKAQMGSEELLEQQNKITMLYKYASIIYFKTEKRQYIR